MERPIFIAPRFLMASMTLSEDSSLAACCANTGVVKATPSSNTMAVQLSRLLILKVVLLYGFFYFVNNYVSYSATAKCLSTNEAPIDKIKVTIKYTAAIVNQISKLI